MNLFGEANPDNFEMHDDFRFKKKETLSDGKTVLSTCCCQEWNGCKKAIFHNSDSGEVYHECPLLNKKSLCSVPHLDSCNTSGTKPKGFLPTTKETIR